MKKKRKVWYHSKKSLSNWLLPFSHRLETCLGSSRGITLEKYVFCKIFWDDLGVPFAGLQAPCRVWHVYKKINRCGARTFIIYNTDSESGCQGSLSHMIWEFITPNSTKYILLDGFHWVRNDSLLTVGGLRVIRLLEIENEVSDIGNCSEMFFNLKTHQESPKKII